MAWWLGIGLGAGLALAYGAASLFTYRRALLADSAQRFMAVMVGGILARMFTALLLFVLVLVLLPVSERAFIGSFFGVFVLCLILEVALLHRRANAVRGSS